MNYYVSISYSTNHYNAINLTSIAIVSEDSRELFLEGLSKAKFRKGVAKFLSEDNTEPKFYTCEAARQQVAFETVSLPVLEYLYFRDLDFLEDYIGEKVNTDFSLKEDSSYPFPDTDGVPLKNNLEAAAWMKKLHEFLIDFELRQKLKQVRKNIGLDI